MEKTFDTAMLALKAIAKLSSTPEVAVKGITMAAVAYKVINDWGMPEETAKEIVFRVEAVQKYSRAALTLEERVSSLVDYVVEEHSEGNLETTLKRVLALDDKALAANIDEMACAILRQIADDYNENSFAVQNQDDDPDGGCEM